MTSFLGCDPDQLQAFADRAAAGAERIARQRQLLARCAEVEWTGADAEGFRARVHDLTATADAGASLLQDGCRSARQEAEQQERASTPGASGGGGIGWPATPPGVGIGQFGTGIIGQRGAEMLGGNRQQSVWGPSSPLNPMAPMISPSAPGGAGSGGPPFGGAPFGGAPGLDPALRQEGGMRADPSALRGDGYDPAGRGDEAGALRGARDLRERVVSHVPVAAAVQELVEQHGAAGERIDQADGWAQEHGLTPAAAPLLGGARTLYGLTGIAVGEDSISSVWASQADAKLANTWSTSSAVLAEAGDGDLAGMAGAVEDGMLRDASASARVLTATPLPAAAGALGTGLDSAADTLAPFVPAEVSGMLRDGAQISYGLRDDVREGIAGVTDPESWLRARRDAAPMPWDQQG